MLSRWGRLLNTLRQLCIWPWYPWQQLLALTSCLLLSDVGGGLGYVTIGMVYAEAADECQVAGRHVRAAGALEARNLFQDAQGAYQAAVNTKCPSRLSEAMAGLVRTTELLKQDELRRASLNLAAARRLIGDLKFAEAKALIERADLPETHGEVMQVLEDLYREDRWVTALRLDAREGLKKSLTIVALTVGWSIALGVVLFFIRGIKLRFRTIHVRPLRETGDGALGVAFADLIGVVARELRRQAPPGAAGRPLSPGPAGQVLIIISALPQGPEVSLKLGMFEIKDVLNKLIPIVWPTRFVIEGAIIPGGAMKLAAVSLLRRRAIRRPRPMADWTFAVPAADTEARLSELRVSAYMVLFRLLQVI